MKVVLILLLICCCQPVTHAQSIWGAEATVGQDAGQFAADFIFTSQNSNYSPTEWTALSIQDGNGSPGAAYWTRNLLGYSQGAYWDGVTPINSPTQANGVAIFDSDYLDNNGIQGAFGTGTSASPHRGELISPRMDLTGYTDETVMLKFFMLYRNFQINELGVSLSTDDGSTWGPIIDYRNNNEMVEKFEYVDFPTDTLAGVNNLTQVRIKFTFDGDYYFAIVDDVTLMVSDLIYKQGFE